MSLNYEFLVLGCYFPPIKTLKLKFFLLSSILRDTASMKICVDSIFPGQGGAFVNPTATLLHMAKPAQTADSNFDVEALQR